MSKITYRPEIGRILDAWLPGKIFYDQTPGLAVAIVREEKLVYARGFGYANLEGKTPVTPETNFRIASISKMFTAIAILQLAEQKKLKLNDLVAKHVPWVKGNLDKVTIKHILSHRGGMLRDGDTSQWNGDNFPTAEEFKKSIERTDVISKYHDQFKYSNFGFSLLGQVIQGVSGMSYEEYVTKNILKRVETNNTHPDFTEERASGLAKGYSRCIPGVARELFEDAPARSYAPAAGFISNVSDLAKFVIALTRGNDLLTSSSRAHMLKKMANSGQKWKDYGLGCGITRVKENAIVGHSGNFPGFVSRVAMDMKNDMAVVVLTNSTDGQAREIAAGILKTIYGLPTLLKKYGKKPVRDAEKYEGTYRERWSDTTVVNLGKSLMAFNPKEASPLVNVAVLVEKEPGVFEINSDNGYGSRGENATFTAQKMTWGTMKSDKL